MKNVTKRAYAGFAWQFGSMSVTALSNIAFIAIMGRLLSPEIFGQFAIFTVLLGTTNVITQFGFAPILVQKKELAQEDINTVFALSACLSLIAVLGLYALAPALIQWFDNKISEQLLLFVALTMFVTVISNTSRYLLIRDMSFKTLFMADTTAYLLGTLTLGTILALNGFGLWSLLISTAATRAMTSLTLLMSRPPGVPRHFTLISLRQVLEFGTGLISVQLLNQCSMLVDKILLGRLGMLSELGNYERAQRIQLLPNVYMGNTVNNVLFSVLSKKSDDPDWLAKMFFPFTTIVSLVSAYIALWIILYADEIVAVILGEQWQAVPDILRMLAPLVVIQLYTQFADTLVRATKQFRMSTWVKATFVVLMTGLTWLGFHLNGLQGAVAGVIAAYCCHGIGMAALTLRIAHVPVSQYLYMWLPVAVLIALMCVKNIWLARSIEGSLPIEWLAILLSDGLVLLLYFWFPRLIGSDNANFLANRLLEVAPSNMVTKAYRQRLADNRQIVAG